MTAEITMIPVESSNIEAIGYDVTSETLAIKFKGGNEYRYDDVPMETYAEMSGSESIGKYFHSHIRGKFEATKVIED